MFQLSLAADSPDGASHGAGFVCDMSI